MDKTAFSAAEVIKAVPLHLQGKSDEAIEELKRGVQKGLFLSELYSTLGQIYFEKKRYEEAADAYSKLAATRAETQDRPSTIWQCAWRKPGKAEEAADAFRKALEFDSNRADARLGLAICQLALKQPELAAGHFDQYLSVHPDSEAALFGKAVCAHMLNRLDEAAAAYKKASHR